MDDLEGGDVNEDELEALDEKLEIDYQIGEDLKERVRVSLLWHSVLTLLTPCVFSKIIPRAIDFFTGKALEYENEDEFDEEDFDDEDDFDEEDVSGSV